MAELSPYRVLDSIEDLFSDLASKCRENYIGSWELTDHTLNGVTVSFCFVPSVYSERAGAYAFRISPDRRTYEHDSGNFRLAHNVTLIADVVNMTLILTLCPADPGHTIDMTPVHIAETFEHIMKLHSGLRISYDELFGEFKSSPPEQFPTGFLPALSPVTETRDIKEPPYSFKALSDIYDQTTRYFEHIIEDVERIYEVRWIRKGRYREYLEFVIPERFGQGTIGCVRQDNGLLAPYIRGALRPDVKVGWTTEDPSDPQWLILTSHIPDISIKTICLEPSKIYYTYHDIIVKLRRIDDMALDMKLDIAYL